MDDAVGQLACEQNLRYEHARRIVRHACRFLKLCAAGNLLAAEKVKNTYFYGKRRKFLSAAMCVLRDTNNAAYVSYVQSMEIDP